MFRIHSTEPEKQEMEFLREVVFLMISLSNGEPCLGFIWKGHLYHPLVIDFHKVSRGAGEMRSKNGDLIFKLYPALVSILFSRVILKDTPWCSNIFICSQSMWFF
jgi:hypothetical protein